MAQTQGFLSGRVRAGGQSRCSRRCHTQAPQWDLLPRGLQCLRGRPGPSGVMAAVLPLLREPGREKGRDATFRLGITFVSQMRPNCLKYISCCSSLLGRARVPAHEIMSMESIVTQMEPGAHFTVHLAEESNEVPVETVASAQRCWGV